MVECGHEVKVGLEGTPFVECAVCHAVFEDGGVLVLDGFDVEEIRSREGRDVRVQELMVKDAHRLDDGQWEVVALGGSGFVADLDWWEPKPGDEFELGTVNWSQLQSVRVGDRVVFDWSAAELNERDVELLVEMQRGRAREWAERRVGIIERVNALPEAFRQRFYRFVQNKQTFMAENARYELFCCEQAVWLAGLLERELEEALDGDLPGWLLGHGYDYRSGLLGERPEWVEEGSPIVFELDRGGLWVMGPEGWEEREPRAMVAHRLVDEFRALGHEEQVKLGMDSGHSGNTFAEMCRLAFYVLAGWDDAVVGSHGALSVLVGSEAYGDVPVESR